MAYCKYCGKPGESKDLEAIFALEMTGDTSATVTLSSGTATMTDARGETTVEDVKDSDEPVTLDLIKKDGSWHMESSPLF